MDTRRAFIIKDRILWRTAIHRREHLKLGIEFPNNVFVWWVRPFVENHFPIIAHDSFFHAKLIPPFAYTVEIYIFPHLPQPLHLLVGRRTAQFQIRLAELLENQFDFVLGGSIRF